MKKDKRSMIFADISYLVSLSNTKKKLKAALNEKIDTLMKSSKEGIIDLEHQCIYRDYISSKSHYKVCVNNEKEGPSIIYDDLDLYVEFVRFLKKHSKFYNEAILFVAIYHFLNEYLPLCDDLLDREWFYYNKSKHDVLEVSIKDIKNEKFATSFERAGLAHNILKILGIASSIVVGAKDGEYRAYNIVYPFVYDSTPAVLFDTSNKINFIEKNLDTCYSFPYFKKLSNEQYIELKEMLTVDLYAFDSIEIIANTYGKSLSDTKLYDVVLEDGIYQIGDKVKNNRENSYLNVALD